MYSCCFIGHRKVENKEKLAEQIKTVAEMLINLGVKNFYFGSRGEFNSLCRLVMEEMKKSHPNVRRIYVRAEYEHIDKDYKNYLLKNYEETFFPEKISGSGRAAYVERNELMIDSCDFCVFYYNRNYKLPNTKLVLGLPARKKRSGTQIAYDYACSKHKKIINIFETNSGEPTRLNF